MVLMNVNAKPEIVKWILFYVISYVCIYRIGMSVSLFGSGPSQHKSKKKTEITFSCAFSVIYFFHTIFVSRCCLSLFPPFEIRTPKRGEIKPEQCEKLFFLSPVFISCISFCLVVCCLGGRGGLFFFLLRLFCRSCFLNHFQSDALWEI